MNKFDKLSILSDLLPGEEAIIRSHDADSEAHARLQDMGLCKGTALRVVKCAPLGDPMEIKLRGFHLSLRKSVAKCIRVQKQHRCRGGHFETPEA